MKKIQLNRIIKFTNNNTRYIITNIKPNYFDALRITQGTRAMWQPIAIRVTQNTNNTYNVTNLNNKKSVTKQGFTTRKPTLSELKTLKQQNKDYKSMKPLKSWISNHRFTLN